MKKNYNPQPVRYALTIGWLYPELMSTYGDRGNVIVLQKRCEWRGIGVKILNLDVGFNIKLLVACDILFMGGAQDRQQKIVAEDLKKKATVLKKMIQEGIPGLYICGAYQFLGKYYKEADGMVVDGLGILDLYTESPEQDVERLIGNVIISINDERLKINENHKSSFINHQSSMFVGFENHGGRTYLGEGVQPLGTVVKGYGNNGKDKTEGAVYKNSFGSYLHGPILPKNPHFSDYLIRLALEKKYEKKVSLEVLDDTIEWQAHKVIANRLGIQV